ncbi:Smr/MutS family protein [Hyphococcus luteus]|uniref:Smr domain-containing protein n=1 Tax=Hyphococcus luteus TaxID=2058213 RepID=A0A2S7K6R6_9PROT|nr:Smr/MutS family protein [Marinicaulis flavus]PQA88166.1 hypothetical protein CW354_07585 [Marinicaulis flavus]
MSRRRGLTPDEEALWRKATRDVAPAHAKKPRPEKLVSDPQSGPKPSIGVSSKARCAAPKAAGGTLAHKEGPLRRPQQQHPFAAGDPRLDKLAARGRLAIDATLDLHGHTQRTARGVLHRFIAEGHARGARCLLVITGKGAGDLTRGLDQGVGRGVLRARLADWIGEEPVRKFVSRASRAHQRHGGAGAFYVFLKR